MSRTSTNQLSEAGKLVNGYDYINQAWVINGVYMACSHPADMDCNCYGTEHQGEPCDNDGMNEAE